MSCSWGRPPAPVVETVTPSVADLKITNYELRIPLTEKQAKELGNFAFDQWSRVGNYVYTSVSINGIYSGPILMALDYRTIQQLRGVLGVI